MSAEVFEVLEIFGFNAEEVALVFKESILARKFKIYIYSLEKF